VGEYDRREAWKAWGSKSCADWLSWRCGISPVAAREQLRVARALVDLPAIREEFEAGRLSYSQVRALTRVATPGMQSPLLELARYCTAAQLDRLLRGYRKAADQLEEARVAHERRELFWWEDRGMLVIQARLPIAEGETLLEAVRSIRDRMGERAAPGLADDAAGPAGEDSLGAPVDDSAEAGLAFSLEPAVDDSAEASGAALQDPAIDEAVEPPAPPSHSATMADALVAMGRDSLVGGASGGSSAGRPEPVVHVDAEMLTADAPGRCETAAGHAICAETARRLGCDAGAGAVGRRDGRALSVGRKRRTIPIHIRRALEARDRGCRFPGCNRRDYLAGHHAEHWAHGGETSEANLVLLCHHHHTLVPEGGYTIRRHARARLSFRRPDGKRIADAPRRPGGSPGRLALANHRARLDIDPETAVTGWQGEHLDLPLATLLLCETRLRL